jgi:hypothetical protein
MVSDFNKFVEAMESDRRKPDLAEFSSDLQRALETKKDEIKKAFEDNKEYSLDVSGRKFVLSKAG